MLRRDKTELVYQPVLVSCNTRLEFKVSQERRLDFRGYLVEEGVQEEHVAAHIDKEEDGYNNKRKNYSISKSRYQAGVPR